MKIKKILSDLRLLNNTVESLGEQTDSIYQEFENIQNCETPKCEKEKRRLRQEMGNCINKLKYEERTLDECESKFHTYSGQLI
ncbi:hypothetical protein CMI37_22110 [Candidatus Pacearchaeota archaeon]|nr:hypothetical protein [Candidatus Pacearchaeota archaeon]|tara:strand:- start:3883 stop:4131 length:249 start_codon:yes stop_codon:yes gene_type:complete